MQERRIEVNYFNFSSGRNTGEYGVGMDSLKHVGFRFKEVI